MPHKDFTKKTMKNLLLNSNAVIYMTLQIKTRGVFLI
jgi:hypothetical protein